MWIKVGIELDEHTKHAAKVRAAQEGRALYALINDAIIHYITQTEPQLLTNKGPLTLSTPLRSEDGRPCAHS